MNNKGFALVITLLVLTLLLTMILEFSMDMRVEARAAANFRDEMQAYYLARSGVTFAIAVLEEDLQEDKKNNTFSDTLNELWAQKIPPVPVGSGTVTVSITDEESKININTMDKGGDKMRTILKNFLNQFELKDGLEGVIPKTIADFIDDNDVELEFDSAENSYYEGLEEHYSAKNRPLDSLQELRMIKGMDGALFNKVNRFLTVNSDGWLNINTASKEVLLSLFKEYIGSNDLVNDIITKRAEKPFEDSEITALFKDLESMNYKNYLSNKSNYFSIISTGNVNNSKKTITAIVNRKENNSTILYWRID